MGLLWLDRVELQNFGHFAAFRLAQWKFLFPYICPWYQLPSRTLFLLHLKLSMLWPFQSPGSDILLGSRSSVSEWVSHNGVWRNGCENTLQMTAKKWKYATRVPYSPIYPWNVAGLGQRLHVKLLLWLHQFLLARRELTNPFFLSTIRW
jgi:hypothetical protein